MYRAWSVCDGFPENWLLFALNKLNYGETLEKGHSATYKSLVFCLGLEGLGSRVFRHGGCSQGRCKREGLGGPPHPVTVIIRNNGDCRRVLIFLSYKYHYYRVGPPEAEGGS